MFRIRRQHQDDRRAWMTSTEEFTGNVNDAFAFVSMQTASQYARRLGAEWQAATDEPVTFIVERAGE